MRKIYLLGIADNITWLGLSSPQDVVREMKSAALFVHPSYIDNSPNSLCEAMIVGTPCIASFVGGIPSLITDNENGLLFPAGEPYSLAYRIKRLLSDKSLAMHLSAKARLDARKRHDPQTIIENMIDIYKEVSSHR